MDKQQKTKILLAVLVVIMVAVWGPVLTGGSKKDKTKKGGKVSTVQGSGDELVRLARKNERKMAKTWYTGWGRNPFTLAPSARASGLEGIMWDPAAPKAIVNGEVLGIGDATSMGQIVDIQPDSVTIRNGSAEKVYPLGP